MYYYCLYRVVDDMTRAREWSHVTAAAAENITEKHRYAARCCVGIVGFYLRLVCSLLFARPTIRGAGFSVQVQIRRRHHHVWDDVVMAVHAPLPPLPPLLPRVACETAGQRE